MDPWHEIGAEKEEIATFQHLNSEGEPQETSIEAYTQGEGDKEAVFIAGVHGDETGPQNILREELPEIIRERSDIKVTVIPEANPFACRAVKRNHSPQLQNVTEKENLAYGFSAGLTEQKHVDLNRSGQIGLEIMNYLKKRNAEERYLFDLHSAAWPEIKEPQVRYKYGENLDIDSSRLARATGLDLGMAVERRRQNPRMLTAFGPQIGYETVSLEVGGAQKPGENVERFGEREREVYRNVVEKVFGYIEGNGVENELLEIKGLRKQYSPCAGNVRYTRELGEQLKKGEKVAEIIRHGDVVEAVKAPVNGVMEGRIHKPAGRELHGPVDQGTRIFNIGTE